MSASDELPTECYELPSMAGSSSEESDPALHFVIDPTENFFEALRQLPEDQDTLGWKALAQAFDHAELLDRFGDRRQPTMDERPFRDGSNIGSSKMGEMFDWYGRWLNWLHCGALLEVHEDRSVHAERVARLQTLSHELNRMHSEELDSIATSAGRYHSVPELSWLGGLRLELARALIDMRDTAEAAMTPGITGASHSPERYVHAMQYCRIEMNKSYLRTRLSVRVMAKLLDKEERFETMLAKRHVEDVYMLKKIRLFQDHKAAYLGLEETHRMRALWGPEVMKHLKDIAETVRHIFTFRLLRDWGFGRPWSHLFMVVDTTDRPDLEDIINSTHTVFKNAWGSWRTVGDLFDVHPIQRSALEHYAGGFCSPCFGKWSTLDLVLQTRCGHVFHHECIFRYWDEQPTAKFPCPSCSETQPSMLQRHKILIEPDPTDYLTEVDNDEDDQKEADWARQRFEQGRKINMGTTASVLTLERRKYIKKDLEVFGGRGDALPEFMDGGYHVARPWTDTAVERWWGQKESENSEASIARQLRLR